MSAKEQFASLVAVGDDRVGLVRDVTAALLDQGVNIPSIRSATLGAEFALLAHFSGTAEQLEAVERAVSKVREETGLTFLFHHSKPAPEKLQTDDPTHDVFVTAYDAAGIVSELTAALARHNINIDRLAGDRYPAPHQGLPLFTISASVHLPKNADENAVRADLEALRDRHGWADAEWLPHAQFETPSLADAPAFPPRRAWTKHPTSESH